MAADAIMSLPSPEKSRLFRPPKHALCLPVDQEGSAVQAGQGALTPADTDEFDGKKEKTTMYFQEK
jgi:hypothetical protein